MRTSIRTAFLGVFPLAMMSGCDAVADLSQFDSARLAVRDAAGASGSSGASGASGTSGSSAPSGASGATGSTGTSTGDTTGSVTGDTTGTASGSTDMDATTDDGSSATLDGGADDANATKDSGELVDVVDAGPPNFLINAGFENGSAPPWYTFTDSNGHSALVQVSTQFVHSGMYSGWVSQRTQTFQGAAQDVTSHIVSGQAYQMSAWVMVQPAASADAGADAGPPPTITGTVQLTAQVSCLEGDGSESTTYTPFGTATANSSGWTQVTGLLSPLNCPKVAAASVYVEGPAVGVDLYVDDLFFSTSP